LGFEHSQKNKNAEYHLHINYVSLLCLEAMLEAYHKLQPKLKTILHCLATEIHYNSVKDFNKWLEAYVSANGERSKHKIQSLTNTFYHAMLC